MQIDRVSFLTLASAIASCTPAQQPAPVTAPAPAQTAEPAPVIGDPQQPASTPAAEGYVPPPVQPPKPPFNASVCADDDVGAPGSCAGLKLDASCAPFPFVTDACNDAIKFYKPKIAERAVACIRKQSPKKLCDAMNTYHCKDAALRSACDDPSADAPCQSILAKCSKISITECRGYLSGMNDAGRAEMVQCMAGPNGCAWGLYSCTEGL